MRIPLDYYQILGIPESCLAELEQAYQDRLDQLPRQEYSDAAIESRRQLISLAYQVLSDPQQRRQYEASCLHGSEAAIDPGSTVDHRAVKTRSFARRPDLEIATEHFLGGLLILFERGEYEEINSICMPYIGNDGRSSNSGSLHLPVSNPISSNLTSATPGIDPTVMWKVKRTATGSQTIPLKPDIVLTMAFSLQELGDREWRNGCYEAAVSHLKTAAKVLVQEDLFPQIQGQIERRLDKLRPYRISYLVALPLDLHEQRRQGIQFLEELLERACINELDCKERFGLNIQQTIQFIHETLPHLTAGEQSHLFSQLARESHQLGANALTPMQLACTCLHVNALIAQGFAYHNPQLIYRAQQILLYRLSQRMDVSTEQAICAVLMGQVEDAEAILATAPDSAALVVIRQQSQGLPNLLRGLCWYIESWLKDEAFPSFRDLTHNDPSLDSYFNDPDVQDFADRASMALAEQADPDPNMSTWKRSAPLLIDVPVSGSLSPSSELSQPNFDPFGGESESAILASITHLGGRPSNIGQAWQSCDRQLDSGVVLPAERVSQTPSSRSELQIGKQLQEVEILNTNVIQLERERLRRRPSPQIARTIDGRRDDLYSQDFPLMAEINSSKLVSASKAGPLTRPNDKIGTIVRRRKRRKPNIPRILLVGTGGLGVACGAVWLANTAWHQFQTPDQFPIAKYSPLPDLPIRHQVTTRVPSPSPQKTVPVGILTKDSAQQLLETWLSAKAKSLGSEYQTAQLKDILVEPALTLAMGRVEAAKADGDYIKYRHHVTVASIEQAHPLAPVAIIQAQVREDADYFDHKKPTPVRSTSNTYSVKYNLVRQDLGSTTPNSRWYIKQIDVIK